MVKVHIYAASGNTKWDGSTVEVSRVPCVAEFVRPVGYHAFEVVRVVHGIDREADTVAGLTLKD